jgi:hypothetical protein
MDELVYALYGLTAEEIKIVEGVLQGREMMRKIGVNGTTQ